MTYIPFYFIGHLKGDPLYSGKLVSAFLLGGRGGDHLRLHAGRPLGAQGVSWFIR